LLSHSSNTDLDYGSYRLSNLEIGLTAGVTGQQGMHLIPPLLFSGVRVSLILTADFSVYLTRSTDFDSGLFRLPNLDTLILTTDFYV
jgi:hypothetical protein